MGSLKKRHEWDQELVPLSLIDRGTLEKAALDCFCFSKNIDYCKYFKTNLNIIGMIFIQPVVLVSLIFYLCVSRFLCFFTSRPEFPFDFADCYYGYSTFGYPENQIIYWIKVSFLLAVILVKVIGFLKKTRLVRVADFILSIVTILYLLLDYLGNISHVNTVWWLATIYIATLVALICSLWYSRKVPKAAPPLTRTGVGN
jgi:hypothetical protein